MQENEVTQARYFVGVIAVHVPRDNGGIMQHNEVWSGAAPSEDAARGAWVKAALDKHPGGSIVYQGVWDQTDTAMEYAAIRAATLSKEGEYD